MRTRKQVETIFLEIIHSNLTFLLDEKTVPNDHKEAISSQIAKIINFDIIKTTDPIRTKFL